MKKGPVEAAATPHRNSDLLKDQSQLRQIANRLNTTLHWEILFIESLDFFKRAIRTMGSSGFSVRGSVVHGDDLSSTLKRTKVMISSIGSNYYNGNFSLIGGVDAVKSFLGK